MKWNALEVDSVSVCLVLVTSKIHQIINHQRIDNSEILSDVAEDGRL